jgi:hypothetical protein
MNAFTDVELARRFARQIEEREARAFGVGAGQARINTARRIGASPGFLENLRRGRIKSIPSYLMQKIREAMIDELQEEIARCEHEIALARQTGSRATDNEILAAQAQVEAAKKILGGK